MTTNRRYWINTRGTQTWVFSLTTRVPSLTQVLMHDLVECNAITYWIFKKLGVNLKAPKGTKTSWMVRRFETWLKKWMAVSPVVNVVKYFQTFRKPMPVEKNTE